MFESVVCRPLQTSDLKSGAGRSQECREASRSKQYLGKARLGAWRRGLHAWRSSESERAWGLWFRPEPQRPGDSSPGRHDVRVKLATRLAIATQGSRGRAKVAFNLSPLAPPSARFARFRSGALFSRRGSLVAASPARPATGRAAAVMGGNNNRTRVKFAQCSPLEEMNASQETGNCGVRCAEAPDAA